MNLEIVRHYIDYFFPREVMGPVVIVFSAEHIIEILFNRYVQLLPELYGWTGIFLLSLVVISVWGEVDEEKEELEEVIEEAERKD